MKFTFKEAYGLSELYGYEKGGSNANKGAVGIKWMTEYFAKEIEGAIGRKKGNKITVKAKVKGKSIQPMAGMVSVDLIQNLDETPDAIDEHEIAVICLIRPSTKILAGKENGTFFQRIQAKIKNKLDKDSVIIAIRRCDENGKDIDGGKENCFVVGTYEIGHDDGESRMREAADAVANFIVVGVNGAKPMDWEELKKHIFTQDNTGTGNIV